MRSGFTLRTVACDSVDGVALARTMAERSLQTDYLVVGAARARFRMAFTDRVIDHADVHVTLVDRRHTRPGGHWQDAYPFVRLHQASVFSTGSRRQCSAPAPSRRTARRRVFGNGPGGGNPVVIL